MTNQEISNHKYFKIIEETNTQQVIIKNAYYFKVIKVKEDLLFCEHIEIVYINDSIEEYHYYKTMCQVLNKFTNLSECWINPNDLVKIAENDYLKHKLV